MIGTTIAHYRIEEEAGAGGMGVVYRAVDVNLKRPVAIKILNAGAIADPDRKRRFVQEAQAASALNHPDIVTIYQIGTDGATDFIAMEFVSGRSLDEVLRGRSLPLPEVVRLGGRIAGALAAAHRAGIVHRDLKPANVMITEKGDVKLLDFGVAKLLESPTAETAITGAHGQTQTGFIVGTLAYMSPEQAQGERVDGRSDIYSFGVLLHEMIAGKRPVPGVPIELGETPRDLRRIVGRCLQPDPDRRYQAMDDVRFALEDADLAMVPAASVGATYPRRRASYLGAGAALLAITAAALAWWLKPAPPIRKLTLTRLTMDAGLTTDPVLSPDGRFIAFASDRSGEGNLDIWVRQVAGGDPVRLTNDPADDREPTFSPDGSLIAFRSDREGGGVYVISTLGGDARRIVDQCRRPRWSPTADAIACWTGLDTAFLLSKTDAPAVYVVAATGGEPRRLFADFAVAFAPLWSPDGKHLLFVGRREPESPTDWWIADANGGSPAPSGVYAVLRHSDLAPAFEGNFVPDAWSANGELLFPARNGDSTNIWRIAITRDGKVSGQPGRVTGGTGLEINATLAASGALAFAAVTNNIDLWNLPIDTNAGRPTGALERLTQDPATDAYAVVSPDGTKIVFASNRSGTYDIWLKDLSTRKDSVLATHVSFPNMPVMAKDGSSIAFRSATEPRWFSVSLRASGGRATALPLGCKDCETLWDLSSDGAWAVFGNATDGAIVAHAMSAGRTAEILTSPGDMMGRLRLSPDDRWIVFNHRAAGSIRLEIAPFVRDTPTPRDRWIAITPEHTAVVAGTWSPDGGTLYYLSDRDGRFCLWAQRMDRATGHPIADAFAVWHFHEGRRSMNGIPLPMRSIGLSHDRIVVSLSEASGNIWLAR